MFKVYKEMFQNLRDVQEQLWKESTKNIPSVAIPKNLNAKQAQTLENMSTWAEKAVNQSLELQRDWLDQWSERAGGKKLKPKLFADLNAEAHSAMQRLLANQNQLLDQWAQIVKINVGPKALPNFDEWDKAVKESVQEQMELLREWSGLTDFKKLSSKDLGKLSAQIAKSIQKSIETHQRLWNHWLKDLGVPALAPTTQSSSAKKALSDQTQNAASATKKATPKTSASNNDLKQILGIGPGLEKKLNAEGISTLEQMAKLTAKDIARLEQEIIRFPGRIEREKWVEQANELLANK